MPQHLRKSRAKAQAIVEFALAATLIFFLLSAAVDIGLMFFSVQGLHNAAQEGATYGSRWLKTENGVTTLDINSIKDRARHESGSQGGIGFVNLLDLDSDGQRDVGPTDTTEIGASGATYDTLPNGNRVIDEFIQVQALEDVDGDGNPLNDGAAPTYTPCANLSDASSSCYVHVVTYSNYKMIFILAPVFGNQIRLSSSYLVPLRSGFSQSGQLTNTPVFRTLTPSITPTNNPTNTPTTPSTATRTNTPTATRTSSPTITSTASRTPTRTNTSTPSNTPTNTPTPTRTNTPTNTPTPTRTNTPTITPTPSRTPTRTNTPTPSNTPTRTPTNTPTSTRTPTRTPRPGG